MSLSQFYIQKNRLCKSVFNILYYYLTDSTNIEKDYLRYTDKDGNKYINVRTKNDQFYIKIDNDALKNDITTLSFKK